MRTFHVKDFEKCQHYKDRSPPWIKLYNETLDDYEFASLPDAGKFHLIAIWLLASRSGNRIPFDPVWVARRINALDAVDLQLLADRGFIIVDQELRTVEHDASTAQARRLSREEERRAEAETETEAETEAETEGGAVEGAREPKPKCGPGRIEREAALGAGNPAIAEPHPKTTSLISDDAFAISTGILEAMGNDPRGPLSVGAPLTVQGWLNAGWNSACILIGVRRVMQSRGGDPPSTLKYFEKAIARAHAELTAPVPIVVHQPGEKIRAQTDHRARPETLSDVARRHACSGISFGPKPTGIPAELESRAAVRLLSQG